MENGKTKEQRLPIELADPSFLEGESGNEADANSGTKIYLFKNPVQPEDDPNQGLVDKLVDLDEGILNRMESLAESEKQEITAQLEKIYRIDDGEYKIKSILTDDGVEIRKTKLLEAISQMKEILNNLTNSTTNMTSLENPQSNDNEKTNASPDDLRLDMKREEFEAKIGAIESEIQERIKAIIDDEERARKQGKFHAIKKSKKIVKTLGGGMKFSFEAVRHMSGTKITTKLDGEEALAAYKREMAEIFAPKKRQPLERGTETKEAHQKGLNEIFDTLDRYDEYLTAVQKGEEPGNFYHVLGVKNDFDFGDKLSEKVIEYQTKMDRRLTVELRKLLEAVNSVDVPALDIKQLIYINSYLFDKDGTMAKGLQRLFGLVKGSDEDREKKKNDFLEGIKEKKEQIEKRIAEKKDHSVNVSVEQEEKYHFFETYVSTDKKKFPNFKVVDFNPQKNRLVIMENGKYRYLSDSEFDKRIENGRYEFLKKSASRKTTEAPLNLPVEGEQGPDDSGLIDQSAPQPVDSASALVEVQDVGVEAAEKIDEVESVSGIDDAKREQFLVAMIKLAEMPIRQKVEDLKKQSVGGAELEIQREEYVFAIMKKNSTAIDRRLSEMGADQAFVKKFISELRERLNNIE